MPTIINRRAGRPSYPALPKRVARARRTIVQTILSSGNVTTPAELRRLLKLRLVKLVSDRTRASDLESRRASKEEAAQVTLLLGMADEELTRLIETSRGRPTSNEEDR